MQKQSRKNLLSSIPAFHQPVFLHSATLAYYPRFICTSISFSIHYFISHTIISSSYPFTPLNVYTSPLLTPHSRISYLLVSSISSYNLFPPALSVHQHLPLGSGRSMYPLSQSAEGGWNIDGLRRRPPPANSAGGTDLDHSHTQSERVNFRREDGYAMADGGEPERSKRGEMMECVCVWVCV